MTKLTLEQLQELELSAEQLLQIKGGDGEAIIVIEDITIY